MILYVNMNPEIFSILKFQVAKKRKGKNCGYKRNRKSL